MDNSPQLVAASTIQAYRAPTAVFITALREEAKAVLEHLDTGTVRDREHRGLWFHEGTFAGNRHLWRIGVAQCGRGNTDAANFVHALVECFDPDILLFAGIAGGVKDDVSHGDVVAATKVYLFQSGKDGDSFLPRPALEPTNGELQSRARFIGTDERWKLRVKNVAGVWDGDVKSVVEPIAAGDVVVANSASYSYDLIKQHYSDAVAVEMEGYGFLSACRSRGVPALVLRGISDMCHDKSDSDRKGVRLVAAAHAAAFAFEVIADITPPQRFSFTHGGAPDDGAPAQDFDSPTEVGALVAEAWSISAQLRQFALKAGDRFERREERDLERRLSEEHTKVVCLLGEPGVGKTSLLAHLLQRARTEGHAVLGLKADLLDNDPTTTRWSERHPNLTGLIAAIAEERRLFVFIDQLDAIADLADLRSERLNWVLDLIREASRFERVSVVCSCRVFEFEHDARLSSLECAQVVLKPPEWSVVGKRLDELGVADVRDWPEDFQRVLSVPQHLAVFLRLATAATDYSPFATYHGMLEEWWRREVCIDEDRRRAVDFVTEELVASESLWCAEAKLSCSAETLAELVACGILRREGVRIGFAHQSVLEFARARSFLREGASLGDYVRERQDAIFVRPTIWSTLTYLREADREQYHIELDGLLSDDVRLHVRYLLIEFLGGCPDPDEREISALIARMDEEEDRTRVLVAIRGREAWFHAIRSSLPVATRWPLHDRWFLVPLINAAWDFAQLECLEFIERYMLADPSSDDLTYRMFLELGVWDERAVECAERLIHRAPAGRVWWAESIASTVSADSPTLAPRIVRAALVKARQADQRQRAILLEDGNGWFDAGAIARAAPLEFLEAVWPVISSDLEAAARGVHTSSVVNEYPQSNSLSSMDDKDEHFPLRVALLSSIEQVARTHPHRFLEITRSSWSIESGDVQVLVLLGFVANPADLAQEGLGFFTGDPRRGDLASFETRDQHYSRLLVAALGEHLDVQGLAALVDYLRTWSHYRPDAELEGGQYEREREARLRLLAEIPDARRTDELREFIERESEELPNWAGHGAHWRSRSGRVSYVSPMSANEMATATPAEIMRVYQETPVQSGPEEWQDEPGGWTSPGGRDSLVRQIRELSKTKPETALGVIPELLKEGDERGVGEVFEGLVESEIEHQALFDAVLRTVGTGEFSSQLRATVSHVLHEKTRTSHGLPDEVCSLLERWLEEDWSRTGDPLFDNHSGDDDERYRDSILWGTGRGPFSTSSSFWTLLALTHGLLARQPGDTERWLSNVERHLKHESSVHVWRSYCNELQWIRLSQCDRERGVEVVRQLFATHPAVRDSVEGVHLIGRIGYLLPKDMLRDILIGIRDSEWPRGRQAAAELLVLVALHDPENQWAQSELEASLAKGDKLDEDTAAGIAFACSHLWEDAGIREGVTKTLCRLIPSATERTADALQRLFWASEDFPADENTRMLLGTIAENPNVVIGRAVGDLTEHLVHVVPRLRRTVLETSRAIVDVLGAELGSIQSGAYSAAPHLVDIAITLQRYPDTRSEALDLFERMLRLGIDVAFASLNDIDLRPVSSPKRESPRRRRRRRKRQ